MGTFKECAVCGGEVVKRKVAKVLRGGQCEKSVKIQAEVCRRCGEHFYGPQAIKRFNEVRAKLKASDAPKTPWTNLQDKLDYEVWLLDFLEKHRNKDDEVFIEMSGNEQCVQIEIDSETSLASHYTAPLLDAMMPLTFVAVFKTLDMLFEWIIAENGKTVPRPFEHKVELLKQDLQLPPLFEHQPHLYKYAKALFCQLLLYRHAVVHENSFFVSEGTLTLSSAREGTSKTLTLNRKQVDCLGRFVRVVAGALTDKTVIDDYKDKMLRHYLDLLAPVHVLPTFGQQMPRFVHVKFTVPKQGPAFPVDLKNVREQVARSFPNQEAIFDLEVKGIEGEQLVEKWHFAPEEIPTFDVMTLYEASHEANRVELILP